MGWLVAGLAVLMAEPAAPASAAVLAPGYVVGEIATPDVVAGGIVARNGVVLVGVGAFGGASQSIVRIDASGATTIADGFNGLAGFVYDAVHDRLLVGDNALEAPGSETGDTIYGIRDPFHRTVPVRAKDVALLHAGTIPGVADLALDPNDPSSGSLFVSDAFFPFGGPQDGKLWGVTGLATALASASVLKSGLGYAAGLAASNDRLFLGEVDVGDFSGRIGTIPLPDGSGPLTPLVSGLAGEGDLAIASDGSILATASGFGSGSFIVRVDPVTGAVAVIASGFGYASALAEENGTLYVVDGDIAGVAHVTVLTPVPETATAGLLAAGLALLARRRRGGRA
jgi:hypothetical protein